MEFRDQVVMVTGGSRGIGRQIAGAFGAASARVVVGSTSAAGAAAGGEAVRAAGGEALGLVVDVSDRSSVERFVSAALERWGRIDVLVNNAGVCPQTPFEEIEPEEWDRVLAVNLRGVFFCMRAVVPTMKKQGRGCIINISSIAGKVGGLVVPPHYSASKAGVDCLTKAAARYLAPHGVRVNALSPANIVTDMTSEWPSEKREQMEAQCPLKRFGTPPEVAAVVLFLASPQAGYITGEIVDVNGGLLMD